MTDKNKTTEISWEISKILKEHFVKNQDKSLTENMEEAVNALIKGIATVFLIFEVSNDEVSALCKNIEANIAFYREDFLEFKAEWEKKNDANTHYH